ncbi:zinc ribbon domain-containing protein [bacterium]|nr:zinc ribbon domain-containing protein [bacterium]
MLYCPVCKEDYRDEIEKCAECGGELVKKEEEKVVEEEVLQSDLPEIIEVYRTLDQNEAEEKVVYLKKNDIKASIFEHIVRLRKELEVFGSRVFFRILVSEDEFENARNLLREMEEKGIKLTTKEINALDQTEKDWKCSRCGESLKAANSICPKCDEALDSKVCSECGYTFGKKDEVCPECGQY